MPGLVLDFPLVVSFFLSLESFFDQEETSKARKLISLSEEIDMLEQQSVQSLVLTPYKAPDTVTTLSSSCRALHFSPKIKQCNSPFIPFCREYLSPLKKLEEGFITNNFSSTLFSPMYHFQHPLDPTIWKRKCRQERCPCLQTSSYFQ
jgi:hypothetical protein